MANFYVFENAFYIPAASGKEALEIYQNMYRETYPDEPCDTKPSGSMGYNDGVLALLRAFDEAAVQIGDEVKYDPADFLERRSNMTYNSWVKNGVMTEFIFDLHSIGESDNIFVFRLLKETYLLGEDGDADFDGCEEWILTAGSAQKKNKQIIRPPRLRRSLLLCSRKI